MVDFFEPMPYADFQCMIDDPPGYRNYWTSEHLADLPDAAIEAIASRSEAMPAGLSQLFMVSWGGAVARVGQDASPLSARDARFVVHPFGMWEDPADDAANIEWARGFRDDLAAFSTGAVYLNFVGDEGEARVRAGYGPGSYERLALDQGRVGPGQRVPGERQRPAADGARDGGMSRDRRLIVGAVGISALGDFLLWIPLTLHVHEQTGSGAAVAALMICLWGPIVLLAPAAGLLADRVETRRLLLWASLAQAVVAAALALALDSTAATLALAALLGAGFAVAQPAEFALVPVIGRDASTGPSRRRATPAWRRDRVLGGALAAAGGTEVAVLVDAASFALVALAAGLLRARRAAAPGGAGRAGARRHRAAVPRPHARRRDRDRARVAAVHERLDRGRGRVHQGRPRA